MPRGIVRGMGVPMSFSELRDEPDELRPEIGLCLSGGGYRAMVFHVGALWRLNEAGLLRKIRRISSVSGGSITAAYLGLLWKDLNFDGAGEAQSFGKVVKGIRQMASTSVDAGAILGGIFLPGTISDRVARAYDETLFDGKTLQDLPDDGDGQTPRFVINATNVQSAALWRFSRPYMGDYRVGLIYNPTVALATAVAASSAFPPMLSPLELAFDAAFEPDDKADLTRLEFRRRVMLSDGGVYDNLGLETVFKSYKTVLVSDAGQKVTPDPDPATDWARHAVRILDVVDNQVRSLRKRALIDAYETKVRTGTYWGIRTHFADYKLQDDPLGCTGRDPTPLAEVPTRLSAMDDATQEKLINWGYAVTDAALRRHFGADLQAQFGVEIGAPKGFPYPRGY